METPAIWALGQDKNVVGWAKPKDIAGGLSSAGPSTQEPSSWSRDGNVQKMWQRIHALSTSPFCKERRMYIGEILVPFKSFALVFTEHHFMKRLSHTDEALDGKSEVPAQGTVGGMESFSFKEYGKRGGETDIPSKASGSHRDPFHVPKSVQGGKQGAKMGSSATCIQAGKHLTLRCKSFNHADSVGTKVANPWGSRNSQHDDNAFNSMNFRFLGPRLGKDGRNLHSPKVFILPSNALKRRIPKGNSHFPPSTYLFLSVCKIRPGG